jgi:hypothetical protein
MQIALICFLTLMLSLAGCRRTTQSQVTEVRHGPFKAYVRSQEFNNSGIHFVDVCVASSSGREFPENKIECLLHGYDISGLSVDWKSDREIEISFDCGRIEQFSNYAVVSRKDSLPVEFHARLSEKCKSP